MDAEDRIRLKSNKQKLFEALLKQRVVTNVEAVAIAGMRAMARAWELQQELGDDVIQIRKRTGGVWEIRYQQAALGPDAASKRSQRSLF